MTGTSRAGSSIRRPRFAGIWLVALGSALWGTDALFRLPLTVDVASSTIVVGEHLVLVAITLPWLLPALRKVRGLRLREWWALLFIGAGASAAATMLFTMAFRYGGPITPVALQKLQPILVALAAALLLGERLRPRYGGFLVIALISTWLLAFADPLGVTISGAAAALLAVGAAALWGGGTVAGRYLSGRFTPNDLTALRFAIGLPTSLLFVLGTGNDVVPPVQAWPTVIGLSLVPGLVALSLYYRGLRSTPAARATLAELAFPITAAVVGVVILGETQTWTQWLGLLVLMVTVVGFAQHEERSRRPAVEPGTVRAPVNAS
ncbi:DMT family transporter [Actinobacteria bacterium YIM 96077]|uniref:EamA family transporter n=1 Tax=Phytoactinopolyspora halophila TaxID=1981511 RepID=A0A329QC90_9ACTN|nr:DMT family transporter [Phytoactinopolyspora halophila]AYY15197.1 DMT family transporter [Actinobacteria bacterium YIM 96077]RAW09867.1 EamA family transporter [Phytoactinopolyspora halophila]